MSNELTLTTTQAFRAMVAFLEEHYQRTKSNDIGSLLGDLQLLSDGGTADPAAMDDWTRCVRKTLKPAKQTHGSSE